MSHAPSIVRRPSPSPDDVSAIRCSLIGGALVGILRPLTRHWLDFAAVGLLVAFVAVCAAGMSMHGLTTHWTRDDWETCIGTALLLGVPGSASFRWIFRSPEK